jgi:signal transduction histidine kinase
MVIERQTKACRRIVSDLLKFSRQSESIKASINLNEIIKDVLSVTEHTLNINKIQIVRNFSPHLPSITGDAEKLHQVFINLFNNAQHAMPGGGQIVITTSHQDDSIVITVQDSGTGIPDNIKNKIFDPFFTTKDVGKGTGLGLSVTYGIIQEHGGAISVESPVEQLDPDAQVPGTAFHITLPANIENSNIEPDKEHN